MSTPEEPVRGSRLAGAAVTVLGVVVAVVAAILIVPRFVDEPSDTIKIKPGALPTPSRATTTTGPAAPFAYQPLFPFRSADDADQWQVAYAKDHTHEPWHLDAGQTALKFSQDFLGYTEVNTATSKREDAGGADVGVGYTTEGTLTGTAATIHLAKLGAGDNAPWEVVGTDDGDLTLTTPGYGAVVTSPINVGGTITGVDESIHVQVRQNSFPSLVGDACCLPAGGQQTPWSTSVGFKGAADQVLTVAVSTGGHLKTVERFAVTGVRAGP